MRRRKREREGGGGEQTDRQANRRTEGEEPGRGGHRERRRSSDSSIMQFLGCFSFWKFTSDLNFEECVFFHHYEARGNVLGAVNPKLKHTVGREG